MTSLVDAKTIRAQFERVAKSASLDVLIPKSSEFDAISFLKDDSIENFRQAPSRRNLFLDERVRIIVVLKTSTSQPEIQQLLGNLTVTLAAHATDAIPQSQGSNAASASGKHDLTSITRNADDNVELVTSADNTFVVWKLDVHVVRPKARLQRPAVYFTANVVMRTENLGPARKSGSAYLQAYEPLPANVLAPLHFDPALCDSKIHLSESRITKVAPTPRADDLLKPIRGASKRALPTMPALFTRIRFSAVPNAVLASLHIEVPQVMAGAVHINDIELVSSSHVLQNMNPAAWPKQARAGDELVSVFRITPQTGIGSTQDMITISISAVANLDEGTSIPLHITWQAHVDLSAAMAKLPYKWSRPLSTSSLQQARLSTQVSSRPASSSSSDHSLQFADPGIVLTITGPSTVRAEETFTLAIQCINHSMQIRRFALVWIPVPKHRQQPPPPLLLQQLPPSNSLDLLFNVSSTRPFEPVKSADVLDLNPDVRIGPLPPGECYETQLQFRAVAIGVLELGMLRLVDLDTRQSVDVKELPDVIAMESKRADAETKMEDRS
nr:hypothetical protein CFP56_75875 [Quercus suber]